jgi:hypothetical protein
MTTPATTPADGLPFIVDGYEITPLGIATALQDGDLTDTEAADWIEKLFAHRRATPSPGKAEAERDGWINVRDMEPVEGQKVLIYLDNGEIESATICEKFKWYAIDGCVVVAEWWMPLPAAPGATVQTAPEPIQPDESDHLFVLLCEIRAAASDNGKRMQSELVPFIAGLARDAERLTWLIDRGLELIACECEVGPPRMYTLGGMSQSIGWFGSQRDAIDAAIQQERDKQ